MLIPIVVGAGILGSGYLLWRHLKGPAAHFVAPSGRVDDQSWSLSCLFTWVTPSQSYMTAALPGTVIAVESARTDEGQQISSQKRVTIQHADGSRLRYIGDSASVRVQEGDRIRASEPIMLHIRTRPSGFMGGLVAFDPSGTHVEDPRPWLALRGARLFGMSDTSRSAF